MTTNTSPSLPQVLETRELPAVTLGATTYQVTETVYSEWTDRVTGKTFPGSTELHLAGPRGATYFLRGFIERGGDTGLRQVISWKSGQPLRQRGNEIRVVRIGDVIEVVR